MLERWLRSLLTPDIVLRLAAVVLAFLIVVRAIFAGADGLWAIVLVLAAAGVVAGAILLVGRVRTLVAQGRGAPGVTRLETLLATRPQSMLAAVLALMILVVHAAITGYVGIWTILAALVLTAVAILLSGDLRVTLLLGVIAAVFGVATMFVSNIFRGSTEARALAVSVAAVVLPILVSDRLVRLVRPEALRPTHHVILAVLTLLVGFLGWTNPRWLPGVLHGCYTLPTSTGITVLRSTPDGSRCYGLLDSPDPGVFATPAFGRHDPVTVALEQRILSRNRPVRDGDLTVVWLGALSCTVSAADASRCADGRDYPAERDQLRALLYAQDHFRERGTNRLHVVIADATQDVAHADDIARLIIDRRQALGERTVVVGGGDSRDVTQRAINLLLGAGIPFIAPNLLADLGAPGRPFVDRPGYLQLNPTNLDYAEDTVARLAARFPRGFRLDVYQEPNPTDQYTTSLVNDLGAAAEKATGASTRHLTALDRIGEEACTSRPQDPPTVLYFADRWTRFADFVRRVDEVCGHAEPRLVVADVSVSRFMANYQLRAVSNADWPVDYYVSGPSCSQLTDAAYRRIAARIDAERDLVNLPGDAGFSCSGRSTLTQACSLDAAVKLTSRPCRANDLGTYLIPAWDAVMLADALLPARRGPGYLASLTLTDFPLAAGGTATVTNGVLREPAIAVSLWHVDPLNDPSRSWETPGPELTGPPARP